MRSKSHLRPLVRVIMIGMAMSLASPALASEGGTSFYLLGSGGPGAAKLPPIEGIFLDNTTYYYAGSVGGERPFAIGGNIVADVDVSVIANFTTLLWVPSTDFAGGTLALGGTFAVGTPDVEAGVQLSGPGGILIGLSREDDATVVGDPVVSASLGWKVSKNTDFAIQTMINVPIGTYRQGRLANLSFHRWATDLSAAITWHSDDSKWDLSAKTGVTFNGENEFTDYDTGTEFHIEGSVERSFSSAFSAGLQAYHYSQISGDSGSGAELGSNKGRVSAIGITAAYNFKIGKIPVSSRARFFEEFGVEKRFDGRSAMLSLTMPLKVKMPVGPPPSP